MSLRQPGFEEPRDGTARQFDPQSPRRRANGGLDLSRPLPPLPLHTGPTTAAASPSIHQEIPTITRKPLPKSVSQDGHSRPHTRSTSQPFPLLFGNTKKHDKKMQPRYEDLDNSDSSYNVKKKGTPNRKHSGSAGKQKEQVITGKCMTCGSTVKWPSALTTFRCTSCLMINDLEVTEIQPLSNAGQSTGLSKRPTTISLERTQRIIDACYDDFFDSVLNEKSNTNTALTQPDQSFLHDCDTTDAAHAIIAASFNQSSPPGDSPLSLPFRYAPNGIHNTPPSERKMYSPEALSSNLAPRSPQKREATHSLSLQDTRFRNQTTSNVSNIFHDLEGYLASCLAGCTNLNMSFFSTKPTSTPVANGKGRVRDINRQQPESVLTPASELEAFLPELDAKVLLLGDVAENGTWWTGNRTMREDVKESVGDACPEQWRGVVSARSPRINWQELAEWYRLILQAGKDWQRRWTSLRGSLRPRLIQQWESVSTSQLNHVVMESQDHLHRSLLKATENLLKRPRRPLKTPEDCRFLLMLLANPLLVPGTSSIDVGSAGNEELTINKQGANRDYPQKDLTGIPQRSKSVLGQHSGILKRILGLLGHLSNDIHLYLISWFARFSDSQFVALVEMVGRFVTYRLTRQPAKPSMEAIDPTAGLIPNFADGGLRHVSQVHAALDSRTSQSLKRKVQDGKPRIDIYSEDWQIRAASRVMAILFQANSGHNARKRDTSITTEQRLSSAGLNAKHNAHARGQIVPINTFYSSMLDHADLVADFEAWETTKSKFTFCQYPFFLSIWAKIHILEHDARRQMETKAREAFFDSILSRKAVSQYLVLKVRRDCLVDDSLKSVSEAIGRGGNDLKKGLRIDFAGEEGVDAGGLRKEWFLLLVREIFDPRHGLFVYDEDSQYCYFNPFCFESSEQFFLVGVLLGLAIYNSTILDVAFPPFVFKKMLASAPTTENKLTSTPRIVHKYTLDDLAELRPGLARGFQQLLEFDGDVETTFCRDFMVEQERYGGKVQVPLCTNAGSRAVTNANRHEFVDMYIHYLLDQSVARQYEPFKRGFFTVCGGNALSLFRPEEIELLVRGSDEPLDVRSLRAVAAYDGWPKHLIPQEQQVVLWFWEFFEKASPVDQRKILSFITGSDRIPAMGATNLIIKLQLLIDTEAEVRRQDTQRFPIARTCFNSLGLYQYRRRATLEQKLWLAVTNSEGFGLK